MAPTRASISKVSVFVLVFLVIMWPRQGRGAPLGEQGEGDPLGEAPPLLPPGEKVAPSCGLQSTALGTCTREASFGTCEAPALVPAGEAWEPAYVAPIGGRWTWFDDGAAGIHKESLLHTQYATTPWTGNPMQCARTACMRSVREN